MNKLDHLLSDPRSHRAVADPDMSSRVAERALSRFQEEVVPSQRRAATRSELREAFARWLPKPRRAILVGVTALGSMAAVLGAHAAMQAGLLRRYDILLKYWLEEVGARMTIGLETAPLVVALFFASAACWLGLALSPRARQSLRSAFAR